MERAKSVLEFYALANRLKDVIRSGWEDWGLRRDRLESVAEHIYGTQMLAIAVYGEYKYAINIYKVVLMLAVHELEEIAIGDLTAWDVPADEKKRRGKEAVQEILSGLLCKEFIGEVISEYEERATTEAKFAYQIDKLECDLQAKLYDSEGCVDLANVQVPSKIVGDTRVTQLLESGKSWSGMWMEFGRDSYPYDDNFRELSLCAEQNALD